MRTTLALAVAVALGACCAGPAAAQAVHGTVRQEDDRAPIQGAMVVLFDAAGKALQSALTDAAGGFTLDAPAPGRFTLRVQRIGLRDTRVPPFELRAGELLRLDVVATPEPIVLEGLTAQAGRRCVVRPAEGHAVATLWEEARKALAAAAFTQDRRIHRFTLTRYTRRLDPRDLRVLEENTSRRTLHTGASPLVSAPAAQLLSRGFVELSDTAGVYYAPDAHVLLSDEFLDAYCFRLPRLEPDSAGLLGLAFEPASRHGPPAIRGTLWIDHTSFQLRFLEFGYTRVRLPDAPPGTLGGRVDFEALPDGTWIVRRFRIRMPLAAIRHSSWPPPGARTTLVLASIVEEGGEVIEIDEAGGERGRGAPAPPASHVVAPPPLTSAAGGPPP